MGNIISEFRKSLNLFDATSIVAGSMIGSGIFIVSADIARSLGSPGWLLIVWVLTGVLTIIAALSYGELASMMPHAGGQYVYIREAYNPLSGFLFGWTLFMVIQTGSIAAVGMAFAKFTGVLFPWFSESNVWFELGRIKITTVHALAIFSILFLSWLNAQGIRLGKIVQNSFTITKILSLIGLIVVGLFFAKSTGAIELNSKVFWDAVQVKDGNLIPLTGFALIAAIGTAMVGALFSADAWNSATFTAGETINPKRNVPLSLLFGTGIVIVLYILANIVYLQALPLRGAPDGTTVFERGIQYATNDRVGTAAMFGFFGSYAAMIMAVLVVISTFGCNNGMILSASRVYYAMANDGLFFKKVGKLNSKGVPSNGLLFQGIWASLLCLSGTYSDLLDYVIFAVLIFYTMTIIGIYILRKKRPDAERPYKAFGYPVVPAIYIIMATLIMIDLLIYKPNYTWPGLIIVLLGIPVYYIWRHLEKKNETKIQ
ncbi:MAG: amino acid permease [Bacteroidales bacterium]|jgi:APA family basic amino acid/polyamine antiporter|nr:amino acid permease [Bacteroidales bacterium]